MDNFEMEAEQVLLGMLIQTNKFIHKTDGLITAEHFYAEVHKLIFQTIVDFVAENREANPITIDNHLKSKKDYQDVGGRSYLMSTLSASKLSVGAFKGIILAVRDSHTQRLLKAHVEHIQQVIGDETAMHEKLLQIQKSFGALQNETSVLEVKDQVTLSEEIENELRTVKPCYQTGIPLLDKAMGGGLYEGFSYCFAARKKTGKTFLGATLASNLADRGVDIAFIAAEMSSKEIYKRILARKVNRNSVAFLENKEDGDLLKSVQKHMMEVESHILFMDKPGIPFEELKRTLSHLVFTKGIKGFILDYIQLVGGIERGMSTAEHSDRVAQWISTFCREHGVWCICMAQLNQDDNIRGGEGVRMAFDQVYELKKVENESGYRGHYMNMMDTRYTQWIDMGSDDCPSLVLDMIGPHFRQL